jgi:hypothetical protein
MIVCRILRLMENTDSVVTDPLAAFLSVCVCTSTLAIPFFQFQDFPWDICKESCTVYSAFFFLDFLGALGGSSVATATASGALFGSFSITGAGSSMTPPSWND